MSAKLATVKNADTPRPDWWEDAFRNIETTLALLIQYARAEAVANHFGQSNFERAAWDRIEGLLRDVNRHAHSLHHRMELIEEERQAAGSKRGAR